VEAETGEVRSLKAIDYRAIAKNLGMDTLVLRKNVSPGLETRGVVAILRA